MASTSEPLLSPPTSRTTPTTNYSPCINKALLIITLSLATLIIISLTSLFTLQSLSSSSNPNTSISSLLLQPSHLCTSSPNPSTCHVIVSDILLTPSNSPTTPLHLFNSLITRSLHQIDDVIHYRNYTNNNIVSVPPPLADCSHLMDVSHDRLIDSIAAITAGAHADARTWLSAVLTNHATCLDGLAVSGTTVSDLESDLKVLMDTASAALAVLNSVEAMSQQDEAAAAVLDDWPAWLSSFGDRKLLEGSGKGISANVVVAKDGSGKYKTVQEAVNSAPDKGSSRYVIYVKKGVYKEKVEIGKKKTNVMIVGDGMDATVITGSLNVVDGSTTFESATLGIIMD